MVFLTTVLRRALTILGYISSLQRKKPRFLELDTVNESMANIPLPPRNADGSYTTPPAGMSIDADGANGQTRGVPVYAPRGFTPAPLDFLANAGGPGNWFGV